MYAKCWGWEWVFSPHHVGLPAKSTGNPCSEPLRHSILKDKGLTPHILHINKAPQSGRCLLLTFPLWVLRRSGNTLHHGSPSAHLPVLWMKIPQDYNKRANWWYCHVGQGRGGGRFCGHIQWETAANTHGHTHIHTGTQPHTHSHTRTQREALVPLLVVWFGYRWKLYDHATGCGWATFITTVSSPL